jgi:hypothetical protein
VNESSLKNPLPWDAVPAVPHEQLNRVQPYLATLRDKSHRRVETEKPFAYLAEDIARLKKGLAEKSVSLNEAERRQEMAQLKTRQEARKREELARPTAQPTTYEITLKNALLPGLPPAMAPKKDDKKGDKKGDKKSDREGAAATPDRDILLIETMKILGDYVDLLGVQPREPRARKPASEL